MNTTGDYPHTDGEAIVPHPDVDNLWVTASGVFWQRVNKTHPERRQWLRRKMEIDKDGYHRLRINGTNRIAHREVYRAFRGDIPDGLNCCHNDGDNTHNHIGNLRVDTQRGNIADKREHGTWQAGATHPRSGDLSIYRFIRRSINQGLPLTGISRHYGVSRSVIHAIKNGSHWSTRSNT